MIEAQGFSRRQFMGRAIVAGAAGVLAGRSLAGAAAAAEPAGETPWQIGCYTRPIRTGMRRSTPLRRPGTST